MAEHSHQILRCTLFPELMFLCVFGERREAFSASYFLKAAHITNLTQASTCKHIYSEIRLESGVNLFRHFTEQMKIKQLQITDAIFK